MSNKKTRLSSHRNTSLALVLVVAGIACYWLLYFLTPLPDLRTARGTPWYRVGLLVYLLVPELLVERWFGWPPQFALLDRLPVLVPAAATLLAALAIGWLVLTTAGIDRHLTRLETMLFAAGTGLSLLSTFVLAMGLCGWLHHRTVLLGPTAVVIAAGCLLLVRQVRFPRRGAPQPAGKRSTGTTDSTSPANTARPLLGRRWLWATAPFVAVVILGAVLPPIEFDVREYHLQAPKEFYQLGKITFLPHNVYANMPLGSEMLCLLAMMLTGDWYVGALAGKTVIAAMMPLGALVLFAAGKRFSGVAAGVVAALCYVSIPWMVQVSNLGLIEGALAFWWLLAIYAAMLAMGIAPSAPGRPSERSKSTGTVLRLFALSGYMAGAAAACKYPSLLFLVLPLLVGTCFAVCSGGAVQEPAVGQPDGSSISTGRCGSSSHSGSRQWGRWLFPVVFLLATVAGCGLWYAKNQALAGNPTYPLLYNTFGGKSWNAETDRRWNQVHRPHDFSPGRLLRDVGRVVLTSPWISPLVIPLAALAVLLRRHRRVVFMLGVHVLWVIATWWLLTHRIDRFWLPVLSELALLAGIGATWQNGPWWRRALIGFLAAGLAWNLLVVTSVGGGYNRFFVPLARLRVDPERLDPWHRYFNEHVSAGRVLLVGEAQVFDFEVPILYNTCFDACILEQLVAGRTAAEVAAVLAEREITYVFVHWGEIERYRSPGNYGFTDFVQPEVFQRLVASGVLEPLPPIEQHPGRAYRVCGSPAFEPPGGK